MLRIETESPVDMLKRDISHAFKRGLRESYSRYGTVLEKIVDTVVEAERKTVTGNPEADEYLIRYNARLVSIVKRHQITIHDKAGHSDYMFGGYSVQQICYDIEQLESDMLDHNVVNFSFAAKICDSIKKIFEDDSSYRRAKFVMDHIKFRD